MHCTVLYFNILYCTLDKSSCLNFFLSITLETAAIQTLNRVLEGEVSNHSAVKLGESSVRYNPWYFSAWNMPPHGNPLLVCGRTFQCLLMKVYTLHNPTLKSPCHKVLFIYPAANITFSGYYTLERGDSNPWPPVLGGEVSNQLLPAR